VNGQWNYVDPNQNFSNLFIWAGGVDYDLWRNYGWRDSQMTRAFIQDSATAQEYCRAMLARQRSRILSGSLTVRGDSKYKVGDCVFIEEQELYFYIVQVQHSFTYGSDFSTTLSCEYARRPGEFIPHPFDVIGQSVIDVDGKFFKKPPSP
jgi:hypothetical protein